MLFSVAYAQNGTISGTFSNTQAKDIVVSLNSVSGVLVKTAFTDDSGAFEFTDLEMGEYRIFVDDERFEPYTGDVVSVSAAAPIQKLPVVSLVKASVTVLENVSIARKKPVIENKIDKVVVNVESMMSAAGGDAMDVLEKSPGIIVNQDGTITFKGKSGVSVFVDGKPTYLAGSELEAYLKSLPASTLNQIELMTNPPAKFDAAGGGGVINITTKKSKARGFNGSYSARASHGKRFRSRQGVNVNYLNDKVRLFGSIGSDYGEGFSDLTIKRRFRNEDGSVNSYFDQRSLLESENRGGNLNAGIDFYASEKTTIGAGITGILRRSKGFSDVNSVLKNAAFVLDSTVVADNSTDTKFSNAEFNLNLRRDMEKGRKFTADIDYLLYESNVDQSFHNFVYAADGSLKSQDEAVGFLPSDIDIVSFKTDYTHPVNEKITVDAGYKVSFSHTDNIADYRDVIGGNQIPNLERSNHFKYDETINAGYVNASATFRRFSFQGGLRIENTVSKGRQLSNPDPAASRFRRDYTNLFPTAYVLYKLDTIGNNQLVINYGKRINRPFYQDLNPFLSPLDKFTFYSGNPYLNPSFAHNFELSYRFKSVFSVTGSYGYAKDEINETIEINDGIYYSRPGNIGSGEYFSLSANAQVKFASWLETNANSELTHTKYESALYTETLSSSGTFWSLNVNNRFTFAQGWSAELSGNYHTDIVSSQFVLGARGSVNASVQKKVLQGNGSIRLIVNDIFYTNNNTGTINNLRLTDATWVNKPDSRFAALSFSYSFGKAFQSKGEYNSGAATEEKNRVKG